MVAHALRAIGERVELLTDHFPPGTPDRVWLPRAGRERWIVITKDQRIRYHDAEMRALLEHDVRAFVLTAGNLTGERMAAALVAALPRIRRVLAQERHALIASISASGEIRILREAT